MVGLNPTPTPALTLVTRKIEFQVASSKTTSHITLDLLKGCWVTYWKKICMLFVSLGIKIIVYIFILCHCYVIYVTKIDYVVL